MKLLTEYLNDAKALTGSDRQTAIKIGCSPQYISLARKGEGLSNKYCFRLAELLKVERSLIVAAAQYSSTKDKEFWKEQWEKIAGAVAVLALAIGPLLHAHIGGAISIM